jgi:hypothetical protein
MGPMPSQHDYDRLRRALAGSMVIFLGFIIAVFAIELRWSEAGIVDGLVFLLACSVPVVAIVAVLRGPFTPESDPGHERFVKGSRIGRRVCFWSGAVCTGLGTVSVWVRLPMPWFIVLGLLLVFWSFRFPRVALPEDHPLRPKPWQFSLRTLLAVPIIVALYMAAVVRMSDPGDALAWRLAQPIVAVLMFGCAVWFVGSLIAAVVLPIRLTWIIVRKVFFAQRAGGSAETT